MRAHLDREGRSPLHYAALDGQLQDVLDQIAAGADVNLKDKGGCTPLHFAAQGQHTGAAKILLKAGAKVDEKDQNGNTPLSNAVFYYQGNSELLPLLQKHGADSNNKNAGGISPAELAISIANTDVSKFFPT